MSHSSLNEGILINDNNINSNFFLGKPRSLLYSNSVWHKLVLYNCEGLEKKYVLKTIMDAVYPNDFIPVNYKSDGLTASFLIKNCPGAILQICKQNLRIQNPNNLEKPLQFSIILQYASTQELKVNVEDNISSVINKRFNAVTKVLNLDAFYKDPDLEEFCPLSQPKILLFVLHICKSMLFDTLILSNNEIRVLDALEPLAVLKVSLNINLKNNLIEKVEELKILKAIKILEITLEGNPVCDLLNEYTYMKVLKEYCPFTRKVDGIVIDTEFQPFRRNFVCNLAGRDLVDQFLEHYFTLYDSNERTDLEGLYHKDALFSLTSNYLSGQMSSTSAKLYSYKKYSRNIKFISNMSKCDEHLYKGPTKITEMLSTLPQSEHDPYSFTIDLMFYSGTTAIFTLTGAFREYSVNAIDTERCYGFTRTFILTRGIHDQYNIVNEVLHVNNITTKQQKLAFRHVRSPIITSFPLPQNDKEKAELISAFKQITSVNVNWSKKYLEECNYNLKNAIILVTELLKADNLPEHAFRPICDTTETNTVNLKPITIQPTATNLNTNQTITNANVSTTQPPANVDWWHEKEKDPLLMPIASSKSTLVPFVKKNEYYNVQLKKLAQEKSKGNMSIAESIVTEMMIKFPLDVNGYKEGIRFYFESKRVEKARQILHVAKRKLTRKKFNNLSKSYFALEMAYGSPIYLISYIDKEGKNYRLHDYFIIYIEALCMCSQFIKAKEFIKKYGTAKMYRNDLKRLQNKYNLLEIN